MKLGRRVLLHWHRYRALPVTLHLERDWRFHWFGIYGLQIGAWFIGAIKGSRVDSAEKEID